MIVAYFLRLGEFVCVFLDFFGHLNCVWDGAFGAVEVFGSLARQNWFF